MKQIVIEKLGRTVLEGISNLKVKEVSDLPEILDGEVLVLNKASSINFPDLLMTAGQYQAKPSLPFVLGLELSGIVVALGKGVKRLKVGDRIFATCTGAFAEFVAVPEDSCFLLPDHMSFAEGSAFHVIYSTAYHCLIERAKLKKNETVLIHGATGGVGFAAVQVAKKMGAKKIIATGGSLEKLKVVQELTGADLVLPYDRNGVGFKEQVKSYLGGGGVDVVYDPVGGNVTLESIRCTNWDARLLLLGFTSGAHVGLPSNLILIKGLQVIGCRAGEYIRQNPHLLPQRMKDLLDWAKSGDLRPHISHQFPMESIQDAMLTVFHRKVVGKVVILFNQHRSTL